MTTINLKIDQLLTCAVEIIADAGDQLIVLGGAVIGVIPAKDRVQAPPALVLTPPADITERVYALYKKHGPCTARHLGAIMKLHPSERYWIKTGQDRLLRAKRLEAVSDGRYPSYRVIDNVQG